MTRSENELIDGCVMVLRQGLALLERLDDRLYAGPGGLPVRSGVGAHFRHCLDFFQSFLSGVHAGAIDYNHRERDTLVERDRAFAITKLQIAIAELLDLRYADAAAPVFIAPEDHGRTQADTSGWCRSSVARELQSLMSHTIHHFALIALMLRLQGFEPGEEFGVNPSTLKHWRREASACAR